MFTKNNTDSVDYLLFDTYPDIVASAGGTRVVFIGFHCVDKYPDSVKAANKADNDKNRSGKDGKDFLENPNECAKTNQQKSHDKKPFCITF